MGIWNAAKELKQQLENIIYDEKCGLYKIWDSWTQRDWNEINFNEIVKIWREEH